MIINSENDWWNVLESHWPNIIEIFYNCGAPLDEKMWSDGIGIPVSYHPRTFIGTLETLKMNHNGVELHHFLQLCWLAAPDKSYIHQWPSWGAFCDLCSEDWVFEPESLQENL